MGSNASSMQVLTAASFVIQIDGHQVAQFSDLGGITSSVDAQEYIYSDHQGKLYHTKQFGKMNPPTVTLKKAVDGQQALWAWHAAVRAGKAEALVSCTLQFLDSSGKVTATYELEDAWPQKIEMGGSAAGSGGTIPETVTIVCSKITGQGM